ncbi:hypothetical protein BJV74DRAFT_587127 [Russula compacta]|nr:hypothetical protein BJV74DRAFT_587127 [Russula compacta]
MLLYGKIDHGKKAVQSAWEITLSSLSLRQFVTPVTSSRCYSRKLRTAKGSCGSMGLGCPYPKPNEIEPRLVCKRNGFQLPLGHLTTQPNPSRIASYIVPILAPSFPCAAAHGAFTRFNVSVAMHVIILPTDGLLSTFTLRCQCSIFAFEVAETLQTIMSSM